MSVLPGTRRRRRAIFAVALAAALSCALAGPAHAKAKDTDGDGMPDRWEKAHGLNWHKADARADADHDGVTNIREYHLGLDPQHANGKKCSDLQIALGATPDECGSANVPLFLP